VIADERTNRDVFYFAKGVKVMDAQNTDVLAWNGTVLTGGDRISQSVFLAGTNPAASLGLLESPIGAAANDNFTLSAGKEDVWPERTFRFFGAGSCVSKVT
jgi:hypothetical protein